MTPYSPDIINFSFAPVEGEVVLHHLEESDIFVGLGSACSARSKDPSKIFNKVILVTVKDIVLLDLNLLERKHIRETQEEAKEKGDKAGK